MIYVTAMISVEDGQAAAFQDVFTRLIPSVRAEEGCIAYEMTVDYDSRETTPERFVIVERWASKAALDAHSIAPHMADFKAAAKGMIKNVELIVTTGIEE